MTEQITAIYAIGKGLNEDRVIRLALERLSRMCTRVMVIAEATQLARVREFAEKIAGVELSEIEGAHATPMAAWRQGLIALWDEGPVTAPVLLTGATAFGPVWREGTPPSLALPEGAGVLAPYWHNCKLDVRFKTAVPDRVPQLDFTVIGPDVLADPKVQAFWRGFKPSGDAWRDMTHGIVPFGALLEAQAHAVAYPMEDDALGSIEPRYFEVDLTLRHGAPCMASSILLLDPLIHDLNAINLRGALDDLRQADPDLYAAIIRFATRFVKARDFATLADQYQVVPHRAYNPDKTAWSFGPYAVFIHAYYADMMPQFWELIERLPGEFHLFITTATEDNAALIRDFLADKGWPAEGAGEVRVVEQNRGRDMSSLFITWRDVARSGEYEVALRLHSKRTPQVARQVGESFKAHLFDNLVPSTPYVQNVLDLMEAEPDIGLMIPPVIHVGFGTLGHAWYNNKQALADLAGEMYIDVPLDDHTPVGAYGTMYWFRPDALWKMFDWNWKWSDYNAEPHHIDGGLAHVQERLIAYAVQDRGYRTVQMMTPDTAARNYGRLEYKAQLFASQFVSNNVLDQQVEMEVRGTTLRGTIYRRLRETYGKVLRRWPQSRNALKPFKNVAVTLLMNRRP
ncbi:rhamnan synthesis F family protein [Pseudaestuariivita atlantica]|uniref:rhamnan synthesis F family protein n=1 Tax=Pseudaestuariivita atlantica TaxID=1317121 RepID=UPI00067B5371|nr:rhamnan synthesis F family protein [Pseudaestuariivita atlantica]